MVSALNARSNTRGYMYTITMPLSLSPYHKIQKLVRTNCLGNLTKSWSSGRRNRSAKSCCTWRMIESPTRSTSDPIQRRRKKKLSKTYIKPVYFDYKPFPSTVFGCNPVTSVTEIQAAKQSLSSRFIVSI